MPNVSIEYYGVTGTGKNVTEAKRDAGEQIRKALDGDYSPSLIRWGTYTVLVWRDPKHGWTYRISHPEAQGTGSTIRERMWVNYGHADEQACLTALAHHIGDVVRPYDETPLLTKPLFEALLRPRQADEEFAKFEENATRHYQFHARHHYARTKMSLTDNDRHDWAGMNPYRPELWQGTEEMFKTAPWEEK